MIYLVNYNIYFPLSDFAAVGRREKFQISFVLLQLAKVVSHMVLEQLLIIHVAYMNKLYCHIHPDVCFGRTIIDFMASSVLPA